MRPEEVWYIGDQYECDVKGSLNAGLFPVWYIGAIDLPYTEDENILTVRSWNELQQKMEITVHSFAAHSNRMHTYNRM